MRRISETALNSDNPAASADFRTPQNQEILYRVFEFAPDAIVLVDGEGRIARCNGQTEKMFGYNRDELRGQSVEILIPHRFAAQHVGHRTQYQKSPRMRTMGAGLELFGRRKDGTEFPVDIMLSPLDIEDSPLVLGVVRDVTERKKLEAQALQVREMYLKEVHHRVKNNLQVISSLLYLQSIHITDSNTLEILKESQSRVKSIALIHEKLYRSTELARLVFAEYVRDLIANLFSTYGVNRENLTIQTRIDDVNLDVDTAIPCGLLINELVSNVLKHAFPDGRSGEVWIELESRGPRQCVLTVRDNGVGMPEGFDWRTSNSLGLQLVVDLARQLDGTVEVQTTQGTAFRIAFTELHYKERS